MVRGERESKKDRSLSDFPMLSTESGWPTENGRESEVWPVRTAMMPPRKQWGMDKIWAGN